VLDAIANQIALDNVDDFEAAMAEWKKLSFNPFGCRIVALGIRSAKHHVTMLAKNDDEERELLRVLWKHINQFKTRCGYNITGFDDAVLVMRSMLLGVEASQKISRKKFGDRASIDLMTVLFPSGQAQKLKEVCRMLGIVPPVGYEMSGDKVFDLTESGDWNGIAAYVESDAVIEFELYQRLSDYVLF
jgi:predicted PolB exonuclease-like 3'-5' exonuclease